MYGWTICTNAIGRLIGWMSYKDPSKTEIIHDLCLHTSQVRLKYYMICVCTNDHSQVEDWTFLQCVKTGHAELPSGRRRRIMRRSKRRVNDGS